MTDNPINNKPPEMISNQAVTTLLQNFDVSRIFGSLPKLSDFPEFKANCQFSITHSQNDTTWFAGTGSLYNFDTKQFDHSTSEFNIINKKVVGTYLETVIQDVIKQGQSDNVLIGRIRILMLKSRTCYTLHRDPEEFRYHIPLVTNHKCFFTNGDTVNRMPLVGNLYKFRTKELHTAVNASLLARLHLVFDTYTDPSNI